uniref:ATP synthase F0 subunit 6 n=1 Tax=Plegadiphilus threskiornis TaxID=2965265 RepID=UPI0026E3281D|nr:ATP synthase F0 subunit 6 [Plegadiphilus threskiornis]WIM51524.1 ATP synthase subunit 6 [Plegadiphilus threskiornis]
MPSLLSIFDPSSLVFSNLNWMIVLVVVLPCFSNFWFIPSKLMLLYKTIINLVNSMFKVKEMSGIFLSVVFFTILLMNISGLYPYLFSSTSHFTYNFSMALMLWASSVIWGFSKNLNSNIAHLTPVGCPFVLVPFMVMVETISFLIRPITLALRLMANMIAGHLILTLISSGTHYFSNLPMVGLYLLNSGFIMFEIGVAFIQSYVYSYLIFLYWEESK